MTRRFDAILFDMDGLMFNTEDLCHLAFTNAAARLNATFSEELHRAVLGTQRSFWLPFLAKQMGIENRQDDFLALFSEEYKENFHKIVQKMPGLDEVLAFSEAHEYETAVVSSAPKWRIMELLNHFRLENKFDLLIGGDEIEKGKPAPDPYQKACKLLNLEENKCVVLEDAQNGVESGFAAGCYVIAIPQRFSLTSDFSKANIVLKSLSQVPKHMNTGL